MGKVNDFFHNVERWLESPATPVGSTGKVDMIKPSQVPTFRRSGPRIIVNRVPRPYWEERGWRREGGVYQGLYQTRYGNWHGHITVSPSSRVEVFIHSPPVVLQHHPHWQCFNKRNDGWYFVHPATPVADVSAGIINLEKTINEAYEL